MLKPEIEDGQASLADPAFRHDVLQGFTIRPRAIPARWFYDRRGSELFEAITDLPEYYPTRTEAGILRTACPEVAEIAGAGRAVVEFGSGSSTKTPILLDAVAPSVYVPIDISGDFLRDSSRVLSAQFPDLLVLPFEADFMRPLSLPQTIAETPKLGFFPGSTLGNFTPDEALAFLQLSARLLRGGGLLLGVDLVKDPALLHAAYNDAQGVTAAFNLNLLRRANAELKTDFDLDGFAHASFYNAPLQRIEMHLQSRRAQTVTLDGESFDFTEGETIHTEYSHKFTVDGLRALAEKAGFTPATVWTDPDRLFSVHWLQAPAAQ